MDDKSKIALHNAKIQELKKEHILKGYKILDGDNIDTFGFDFLVLDETNQKITAFEVKSLPLNKSSKKHIENLRLKARGLGFDFEFIPLTLPDQPKREINSSSKSDNKNVSVWNTDCSIEKETPLQQRCLDVDEYASILAKYFQAAKGEFCFGLFGHWGRGKTYLMKIVADNLSKEKYDIVTFSAWKYKTTPELWIFLYESFVKKCKEFGWLYSLSIRFKRGIYMYGWLPLFIALIIFGISLWPFSEKLSRINGVAGTLGLTGFILFFHFLFGFYGLKKALQYKYFSLVSHYNKLGLQALVGDDLKGLLMAWCSKNWCNNRHWILKSIPIFLGISFVGYSLLHKTSNGWPVLFMESISIKTELSDYWFNYVLFSLWILLTSYWFTGIMLAKDENKKILLVIDDLDRCKPSELVNVIDCLKLFIEDEDIHERVQIVMLLDETILRKSIAFQFMDFIDDNEDKSSPSLLYNNIVNEHIEKIFVSYIRLKELSLVELKEATKVFIGNDLKNTQKVPEEVLDNQKIKQANGNTNNESVSVERIHLKASNVYSEEEERCLIESILNHATNDKNRFWGPRSIRAFLFKYQLSRLLLAEYEIACKPEDIVAELMQAIKEPSVSQLNPNDPLYKVQYIVRQVA